MKFKFSAIIGRGKGNEAVFTEEVDVPEYPANGSDFSVVAAYNKWERSLTKGCVMAPVKEK